MIYELLNKYENGEIKPSKAYVQLRAWKSEIEDVINPFYFQPCLAHES